MAIEVSKTKKKIKVGSGMNTFFQVTLFLFFIVGTGFLGVSYLHSSAKKVEVQIEEEIQKKIAEVPEKEEIEERIRAHFELVNDFKLIETSRFLSSRFFDPFQKAIHPEVEVFNANIELKEGRVNFSGEAKNITVISEQFKGFKDIDYVTAVTLSSMSIDESTESTIERDKRIVEFSFTIEIDTELFKSTTDDYSDDDEYSDDNGEEEEEEEEDDNREDGDDDLIDDENDDDNDDIDNDLLENNDNNNDNNIEEND